jgi:hypothetical protein
MPTGIINDLSATNAQKLGLVVISHNTTLAQSIQVTGTATIDSTAAQTAKLTYTLSANNASLSAAIYYGEIAANY